MNPRMTVLIKKKLNNGTANAQYRYKQITGPLELNINQLPTQPTLKTRAPQIKINTDQTLPKFFQTKADMATSPMSTNKDDRQINA